MYKWLFHFFAFLFCIEVALSQSILKDVEYYEHKAESVYKKKDSLIFYANKILKLSNSLNDKRAEALAYRHFGQVAFLERDLDKADQFVKKSLSIFNKEEEFYEEKGDCYLLIGRIEILKRKLDLAYENLMLAKQLYKSKGKLKHPNNYFFVLNDIAYLYILTEEYDKALEILNSNQKADISNEVLANIYSLFSILVTYHSDFKEAIKYFKLSIPIYEKLGLKDAVLISEMDIAINYYYLEEFDIAIKDLNKVLKKVTNKREHFPIEVRSYLYLSQCYFEQKKYSRAKEYFNKVESLIANAPESYDVTLVDLEEIVFTAKVEFLIFDKKYKEAKEIILKHLISNKEIWLSTKLSFYKQLLTIAEKENKVSESTIYKDSISKIENQIKFDNESNSIALMRAEFKFNVIDKELEIKNKEFEILKIKEKNNQIVLVSFVGFGVIALIFFFILFSRQKKINKMREAILTKEKLYLESINNKKALEIDFKNKEIVDFALHISEKNEILNEIKSRIKEISPPNRSLKNEINEILFFINNTINQNSEKIKVYSDAEDVKDSFFQKLKTLYPNLTEKETRIASLVRMQLSSKQISQQLNITPASVDNYRSVLRKKMNLKKEDSLFEYLNQLG